MSLGAGAGVSDAVIASATEVFLWGHSAGKIVECSFGGYGRRPVTWSEDGDVRRGSRVGWRCDMPHGCPVAGWGLAGPLGTVAFDTIGEVVVLNEDDEIEIDPSVRVFVPGGVLPSLALSA